MYACRLRLSPGVVVWIWVGGLLELAAVIKLGRLILSAPRSVLHRMRLNGDFVPWLHRVRLPPLRSNLTDGTHFECPIESPSGCRIRNRNMEPAMRIGPFEFL